MKYGKEEIQKMFLAVLLFFGVIYGYFNLLLGPLEKQQETLQKSVIALGPEIAAAKAQIQRTHEMEADAPRRMATTRQVTAMMPDGSPVAWFPPRLAEFFKKHGLEKSSTRLQNEMVDKEMVGFRKLSWGIDLPKVGFVPFAIAVAALENEEPLLEINSLQLEASREDVEMQHVLLSVSNIVKQ